MGLWKRMEQALWTGDIPKEYGPVSEGRYGATKRTVSALLAHREGRDRLVLKTSHKALFGASVQYVDLDRESVVKLKAAVDDALQRMH